MTEMSNPSKLLEHQITWWSKTLKHLDANRALLSAPGPNNTRRDKRFSGELWDRHPYFNYIKQQYLLSSEAIQGAIQDIEGLEDKDKVRLDYFAKQIMDMLSPANFLGTNPDALAKAVETEGQSLIDGLENLVDLEANDGDLVVTLRIGCFTVGENIDTSQGEVVFRNRMFELIQYTPTTEQSYRTPLVIFPPWINKFYILYLKARNSLIKWIVDQGFTLFVVSWVNPDASYAEVGMDQYVEEGYLTAIDCVKKITGEDKVNAVGYHRHHPFADIGADEEAGTNLFALQRCSSPHGFLRPRRGRRIPEQ